MNRFLTRPNLIADYRLPKHGPAWQTRTPADRRCASARRRIFASASSPGVAVGKDRGDAYLIYRQPNRFAAANPQSDAGRLVRLRMPGSRNGP